MNLIGGIKNGYENRIRKEDSNAQRRKVVKS